jgi:hypothetical protein
MQQHAAAASARLVLHHCCAADASASQTSQQQQPLNGCCCSVAAHLRCCNNVLIKKTCKTHLRSIQQRSLADALDAAKGVPLICCQHYDFSLMRLSFGSFKDKVAPRSRHAKGSKHLPFDDLEALAKANARSGTLEVFAQGHSMHFLRGTDGMESHKLFCAPINGQSTSASCTHEALDTCLPCLSTASIVTLAEHVPWIVWCDGPDNAGACPPQEVRVLIIAGQRFVY